MGNQRVGISLGGYSLEVIDFDLTRAVFYQFLSLLKLIKNQVVVCCF
ncbi:hypothetical protein P872_19920 [Rhodonellum psychrophilum GCM71 = DSM 17998]|uniref:Uncharacterized protein n=1 Tax=Rhodonellum psychrophilum GCM71 = DSM 17998 TaxID=1123057 RepID=U5BVN7_9BACT|nr:hypothetical protein P872_19920 [Rhodonellum psychrophilum GCM71 = DSM 17998]